MNRMERLMGMVLLLQDGRRSAREIAAHFEVSRRTVQRDIDALCEMGIPVIAEVGTMGGYRLPEDYFLPPLALTLHETLLLRLAMSSLSQLSEMPFKREWESLLAKVQTLWPRQAGVESQQWQQMLSLSMHARPFETPYLDQVVEGAREGRWLAVRYRSERGDSEQKVLPRRVYAEAGLWYCEAYSYERRATRVYRVDRFLHVQVAKEVPTDEAALGPIVHVDGTFPEICVRLSARGVLRLEREAYLAARIERQEDGTGVLRVRLRRDEYEWLARILLGLGKEARVMETEELRTRVLGMARDVVEWYEGGTVT